MKYIITGLVLQLVGIFAMILLLSMGVQILQDNGGLKAAAESIWCGTAGCDSE